MKSPEELAAEAEIVARAYHDTMFEERWDDLPDNGIDKALHRQCAAEAIKRLDEARHMARNKPRRLTKADYKPRPDYGPADGDWR